MPKTKTASKNEETTSQIKKIANSLESINIELQRFVAIQLYINGASQDDIAANLKISKGKANALVKGVKRKANAT